MIEAIIWDIDGTLVDSEPLHLLALQHVCYHYEVDLTHLPDDHFIGIDVGAVWNELRPLFPADVGFSRWLAQLNDYYITNADKLTPIRSAVETIRRLHAAGFRQAAASNSNRKVVDANLGVLGVADLMECSISLDDVAHGKPDPAPYLRALETMGLHPSKVRAVEDSPAGALSAARAGIAVFGFGNPDLDTAFHVAALDEIAGFPLPLPA
jgi:HAD superfamily hydrolase (TIGR01509 family)